jgi:hypothetical protein
MKAAQLAKHEPNHLEYMKTAIKAAAKGMLLRDNACDRASLRSIRRWHYLSKASHHADLNANYIYFPLNYQPELTTSPLGGIFCDQISAVQALAAALPEGWLIYVKEHPSQYLGHSYGHLGRTEWFYSQLKALPRVEVLSTDLHSQRLIDGSMLVATITGSAGYESLARSKCVIVFGDVWYAGLHGCFRVDKPSDVGPALDKARKFTISPEIIESQFNEVAQQSISFFGEASAALSYDYNWDPCAEQLAAEQFLHSIVKSDLETLRQLS